jgi:hypothetical protein
MRVTKAYKPWPMFTPEPVVPLQLVTTVYSENLVMRQKDGKIFREDFTDCYVSNICIFANWQKGHLAGLNLAPATLTPKKQNCYPLSQWHIVIQIIIFSIQYSLWGIYLFDPTSISIRLYFLPFYLFHYLEYGPILAGTSPICSIYALYSIMWLTNEQITTVMQTLHDLSQGNQ